MSKDDKQNHQLNMSDSRLEQELAALIGHKGTGRLQLLMGQMAALEVESPKFYVTSRPACNSD